MCFLGNSIFSTKDRGKVKVEDLNNSDILLDGKGGEYEIVNIYKLPEYKVVKMVRIMVGQINGQIPIERLYLKPTHYVKINAPGLPEIIKAKDFVDKYRLAEYEKYNIINFYLLNVRQVLDETSDNMNTDIVKPLSPTEKINHFVEVNGLSCSVYNTSHPLNNRFQKYSINKKLMLE